MLRYMLDTDTCIYVMKRLPPGLSERFNTLAGELCMSCMTLAELHFGAEKSARRVDNLRELENFAARMEVLPFTTAAAAHYGQLRAHVERAGTPVGSFDLLIGAHARAEGLIVVTNNVREFARLPGIQVETWI